MANKKDPADLKARLRIVATDKVYSRAARGETASRAGWNLDMAFSANFAGVSAFFAVRGS
jgi:hypothetical protein